MLSPVITTGRNAIVRQSKRSSLLLKNFNHHSTITRHASSSSAFADIGYGIPDAIRKSVKSRVLDEVTKSDSQFWTTDAQPVVNGSATNANHYANGSDESSINTPLNTLPPDPLTEWHLHATPRYDTHPASSINSPTADPFALSRPDIDTLSHNIYTNLLQSNHPVLAQAASYFFSPTAATTGKKIRPTMVALLSRALPTRTLLPSQRRLAEISEMIHTASLFHDDVIDNSDTRRGVPSVHKAFHSDKMAILAGDYLLARASVHLARLRNVEVVETMSTIIEHLVRGEVMQMRPQGGEEDDEDVMIYYLRKNFYKTASLMANSCKSTALLAGCDPRVVARAYNYGKHVGIAFQLSDDVLDFEGSSEVTGKPSLSDLRSGLATAPVLFCLREEERGGGGGGRGVLREMMERRFSGEGDVERAWECVMESEGLRRTKDLARVHAEVAVDEILGLEESDYRDALVNLAFRVVDRTR